MKVAVHVHSDWSYDGRHCLEEIHNLFAARKYEAVFMCEHCRTFDVARWSEYRAACRAASGRVLLVPGIEYSDERNCMHIPIWGCEEFLGSEIPTSVLLERCPTECCFVLLAHPARRNAWERAAEIDPRSIHAFECWNRKADGLVPWRNRPESSPWCDWHSLVALDYHSWKQAWPLSLRIEEASRSETDLIASLREGRFRNYLGPWDLDSPAGRGAVKVSRLLDGLRPSLRAGGRAFGLVR